MEKELRDTPPSKRWATLLVVLVGLGLMALRFSPWPAVGGRDLFAHPYRPYYDETFQAILIERAGDSSFPGHDPLVQAIEAFWPGSYFAILAGAKRVLGGLEPTILVATFLVAAFFIWGCHRLGRLVTGSTLGGALVALISAAFPRDALIAEWGMETLVPREVTMAAAPWLFEAFLRWGGKWRTSLLFLALGLLANIHALSALHLVLILAAALLVSERRRGLRTLVLGAVLCGAGAAPVALHFGGPPGAQPPEIELVLQSSFAYFVEPFFYKLTLLLTGFALLFFPAVLGFALALCGRSPSPERRFRAIMAATVGVASLYALTRLEPALVQYSPLRVTKFFYLFAYVYGAFAVVSLLKHQGPPPRPILTRALGLLLAACLVIPAGPRVWVKLRELWPAFDQRCRLSASRLPDCFRMDVRIPAELDWDTFHEMASVVRERTPVDAVFLLPPRGFSPFRLYARRAVVVLGEDSVVGLYDAETLRLWLERLTTVVAAYEDTEAAALTGAAQRYGADFIVLRPGDPALGNAPLLWEKAGWRIVASGVR
ncbi:MAG: DUF6798 domain-containing protein [Planctomycetota bacterium]